MSFGSTCAWQQGAVHAVACGTFDYNKACPSHIEYICTASHYHLRYLGYSNSEQMVVEIYVHVVMSADSQAKLQNLNPSFVCDEEVEYERAVQSIMG